MIRACVVGYFSSLANDMERSIPGLLTPGANCAALGPVTPGGLGLKSSMLATGARLSQRCRADRGDWRVVYIPGGGFLSIRWGALGESDAGAKFPGRGRFWFAMVTARLFRME